MTVKIFSPRQFLICLVLAGLVGGIPLRRIWAQTVGAPPSWNESEKSDPSDSQEDASQAPDQDAEESAESSKEAVPALDISEPQYSNPDIGRYHSFNFRLGMGGTSGPATFLILGNFEYQPDPFFSFGPMIQFGVSENVNMTISTLNGRLTVPIHALVFPEYRIQRVDVSLIGGAGTIYRRVNSFAFTHYNFVTGLNADVYILDFVSVGLGGHVNITSSDVERFIGAMYASGTVYF